MDPKDKIPPQDEAKDNLLPRIEEPLLPSVTSPVAIEEEEHPVHDENVFSQPAEPAFEKGKVVAIVEARVNQEQSMPPKHSISGLLETCKAQELTFRIATSNFWWISKWFSEWRNKRLPFKSLCAKISILTLNYLWSILWLRRFAYWHLECSYHKNDDKTGWMLSSHVSRLFFSRGISTTAAGSGYSTAMVVETIRKMAHTVSEGPLVLRVGATPIPFTWYEAEREEILFQRAQPTSNASKVDRLKELRERRKHTEIKAS